MVKTPNIPFGTAVWAMWWAWYIPIRGSSAVNSYVNEAPGWIRSWVRGATPSMLLGVEIPCQWISVPSGSWLSTTTRTRSPTSTWMAGPGTVPL